MPGPEALAMADPAASAMPPERRQHWTWYNILAFWLADVHSVGGYVFAASLFAFGLTGWQVLITLLVGIVVVQIFANLMGRPGQQAGIPYAVVARMSFGVFGANIAALIRGGIAVVWYGIQTYLASGALTILLLKFFHALQPLTPWNLFNDPAAIHYTVDLLAAAIGPLCGIMLTDYYLIRHRHIDVRALFSDRPGDAYWYRNGFNPAAVKSVTVATLVAIATGFVPGKLKTFSIFIGGILAAAIYYALSPAGAALPAPEAPAVEILGNAA
ncbi:MAG: cytosine permease [Acidiphilium sp.]